MQLCQSFYLFSMIDSAYLVSMNLSNKKVLVTGGAQRLGAIICEELAATGADIAIHYRSSRDYAQKLATKLASNNVSTCTLYADLSQEEACKDLIEQASNTLNGLDILINNASVFLHDDLNSLSQSQMLHQFQVNLMAPLLLSKAFQKSTRSGKIINLLDQRIEHVAAKHWSYSLSKKALADATRMLALEMAPAFTVNAVAPGAIIPPDPQNRNIAREPAGKTPLQNLAPPSDVTQAILYLLQAESVTGQIIYVDAGQHLGAIQ